MNLDNPLGRHTGQPSIQLSPRGGKSNRLLSLWERIEVRVSRYPALKNSPRSGQDHDVVPLAWEIINHLDSGLRRNDVVFLMDNLR